MKDKRVFVYTEAAPAHQDVVVYGLNRAGVPIMRAISDHIAHIAIFPIGPWLEKQNLDLELADRCSILPRPATLLCKALNRYPRLGHGLLNALPPLLLAPSARKSDADIVFIFVGADVNQIIRGERLARLAGKPYAYYLVDDFILPMRNAGASKSTMQRAAKQAGEALRGASHVFAITDGLGEHLREYYGVSPTTLSLAFEPGPRPTPGVKNQIIFVGGTNFLYAEGLQDLFKTVGRIRATGSDLTVRLTVPAHIAVNDLGELPPFVISEPIKTADGLAHEIAASLFSFLPYSFDQRIKPMVSTSFPSKSIEYLAYARSIVVYGPDYGVATQYFQKANLPFVVSSVTELEETTKAHLTLQPDYSARYLQYLAVAHSLASVRKTICSNLSLEA